MAWGNLVWSNLWKLLGMYFSLALIVIEKLRKTWFIIVKQTVVSHGLHELQMSMLNGPVVILLHQCPQGLLRFYNILEMSHSYTWKITIQSPMLLAILIECRFTLPMHWITTLDQTAPLNSVRFSNRSPQKIACSFNSWLVGFALWQPIGYRGS